MEEPPPAARAARTALTVEVWEGINRAWLTVRDRTKPGAAQAALNLVDSLKGPDLSNISTTAPREQRRAVSAQVAAKLTELMIGAEQYTQQKGAIPGVQIASKTGTAEHGTDPRNTPPHAWYIAFAPARAPKVAIAVLVENGGNRLSATGGALAAPIGRATIAAALREGT